MERSGRRGRERLSSLLMTEGQREEQRRRQSKAKRRRMSLSIKVSAGLSSLFGGRFLFCLVLRGRWVSVTRRQAWFSLTHDS